MKIWVKKGVQGPLPEHFWEYGVQNIFLLYLVTNRSYKIIYSYQGLVEFHLILLDKNNIE